MAIGALIIGAVFVNNLILVQFLGICPFLGVSKKVESAFGMGMAVIFVMTVSSLISSRSISMFLWRSGWSI